MILDPILILCVAAFVLFALLVARQWIPIAMGISGLLAIFLLGGTQAVDGVASVTWGTATSYTLTAVPMFLLMGNLILESGLSESFFAAIAAWVGRVPGGLLHANILTCTAFAAVTGSSAACAAAIAPISIPELRRRHYKPRAIFGSIAGGGTLGVLLPPSVGMIVYGAVTQQSVAKLFVAGLIPGLLMAAGFMLYIFVHSSFDGSIAPDLRPVRMVEKLRQSYRVLPIVALIAAILGAIYTGLATPTEAAAIGSLFAVLIGATLGKLRLRGFRSAAIRAANTTAMVLFLIIGAQILSFAMVLLGINRQLSDWVGTLPVPPLVVFVAIVFMYWVLGSFLDGISMILLTLPVLFPVIIALHFNPIWFGVIMMIMVEHGGITPPVGPNLFIVHQSARDRPLADVVIGSLPYAGVMLVMVSVLWWQPNIALFLTRGMP